LSPIKAAGSESQAAALPQTRSLAWCEHQFGGVAQRIDERANFGTWSAARSADRVLAFFFVLRRYVDERARWSHHRHVFVIVIARRTLKMRPTTPRFARSCDTTSDLGRLMITNMGGICRARTRLDPQALRRGNEKAKGKFGHP
jgi:hypothetical protein